MASEYRSIQQLTDECIAAGLKVTRRQVQHCLDKNGVPAVAVVGIAKGYSDDVLPWLLRTLGIEEREQLGRELREEWEGASFDWLRSLRRIAERPAPPAELGHLPEVQEAIRHRDEAINVLAWHDVADVQQLLQGDETRRRLSDAGKAALKAKRTGIRLLCDVSAPRVPFFRDVVYPAGTELYVAAQLADELVRDGKAELIASADAE